jgi:hypothetical protein
MFRLMGCCEVVNRRALAQSHKRTGLIEFVHVSRRTREDQRGPKKTEKRKDENESGLSFQDNGVP